MTGKRAVAQRKNRMFCYLKKGEDILDRQKQHLTATVWMHTSPWKKLTLHEGNNCFVQKMNQVSSTVLSISHDSLHLILIIILRETLLSLFPGRIHSDAPFYLHQIFIPGLFNCPMPLSINWFPCTPADLF